MKILFVVTALLFLSCSAEKPAAVATAPDPTEAIRERMQSLEANVLSTKKELIGEKQKTSAGAWPPSEAAR